MKKIFHTASFLLLFITGFTVVFGAFQSGQVNQRFSTSPYYDSREDLYDVKFYFLDLEVTNQSTFITGSATVRVQSLVSSIDSVVLELFDFYTVDSVAIQNTGIGQFSHRSGKIIVPVPPANRTDDVLTIRIFYNGQSNGSGFFNGISNSYSFEYQKRVTYTLSEPFQGSEWFPCKQNLTDKADSAWIFITTDSSLMAGSNGILTARRNLPAGKVRYEWKTRYPLAYYLISMSVADYREYSYYVRIGNDSVFFQNFIYDHPRILEINKNDIDKTADLLSFYSQKFGRYPFYREKYGHSMAPMGGGMEHQTMTTIHNFRFGLVAHELAHQWFGDLVTTSNWKDIWLNEGFASYIEYIALDELKSHNDALAYLRDIGKSATSSPEGSVVVPDNETDNELRIFNVDLTYHKGAYLVHMFRQELNNDETFFRILRNYLDEFADSTANVNDFIRVAETESGTDWNWFFDQWYYGRGFPVFTGKWYQSQGKVVINLEQSGTSASTPFFRTHLEYNIAFTDGKDTTIKVLFDKPQVTTSVQVSKTVKNVIVDPEEKVLRKVILNHSTGKDIYFTVKPNPFHDNLTIGFEDNTKTRNIKITSLNGRVFYNGQSSKVKEQITLSFLPPGLYLITIGEGGRMYTEKIIKN